MKAFRVRYRTSRVIFIIGLIRTEAVSGVGTKSDENSVFYKGYQNRKESLV